MYPALSIVPISYFKIYFLLCFLLFLRLTLFQNRIYIRKILSHLWFWLAKCSNIKSYFSYRIIFLQSLYLSSAIHGGCARIKRYDNTNLNTRTCNYEMDFTILNERCTVSKTKRKQRKFTTINTEKG